MECNKYFIGVVLLVIGLALKLCLLGHKNNSLEYKTLEKIVCNIRKLRLKNL
ncbi:hypothetical protein FDE95_18710 [Clostridium botulinum]|uniref:Uncharacterized protein n=1 Tax=Clostridium botulinum TaxID=1491 RepID=A0A6G4EB77_CLOBO|nr:hypothetical protein RSJ5_02870 [Clostridium botulinum]MBN3414731.1 hypothetical protein [Clostridium botulinum]MBN3441024.1 hypothetical protein [Clostridium botulinum]NFB13358.1 hypothetical protein [Clostridium botulinum]NFH60141.1 hypothetical protein [Clostridium botulinum]